MLEERIAKKNYPKLGAEPPSYSYAAGEGRREGAPGQAESSSSLEACGSGKAARGPPGARAVRRERERARAREEVQAPGRLAGRAPPRPSRRAGDLNAQTIESECHWEQGVRLSTTAEEERTGSRTRGTLRPREWSARTQGEGGAEASTSRGRRRPEDKARAVRGVPVPGNGLPAPREVRKLGPRKRHTPSHSRATAKAPRNGKKMFLTGRAQLVRCSYPGKENGE